MAQSVDFYIDVTSGQLIAAGSGYIGSVPTLTRNDSYTFRLRLQERDASGFLRDISTSGIAAKIGIGGIDDGPSDGQFKLALNATTSSAISFNATTTQLYNSISAIAVGATVTTYGNDPYSYLITSATQNTAMSFGGDAFTLFPTSSVLVSTRRFPKTGVAAQQIIQLRRNPAVYADTFIPSPTGGIVSLSKIQDGGTAKNESFLLKVGSDAIGGGVVLNYGSNSTTAIPIGSNTTSFTEALQSVTGIGVGNISVDASPNFGEYTISFVKALGNTNLTTGFTLDASGVVFANFIQSTVTMATAELDELFAEAGTDSITPTIEIEVTQSGKTSTVYQSTISVRRDLITTGSVVPAAQASYYTKSETDALFVEDSTLNVDATNRILIASSNSNSVDWEGRGLYDSSDNQGVNWESRELYDVGENITLDWNQGYLFDVANAVTAILWKDEHLLYDFTGNTSFDFGRRQLLSSNGTSKMFEWQDQGIAFFGVTTKSQVTQGSAVSALIDYGLLASSTTYGALPLSSKTLTTTASLYFGQVNSNSTNSISITVTGCNLNDIVLIGLPPSINNGLAFSGHVTTSNGLEVDCINATNGNITPATATYRITVIGY